MTAFRVFCVLTPGVRGSGCKLRPAFHEHWFPCMFRFQSICRLIRMSPNAGHPVASLGFKLGSICPFSSQAVGTSCRATAPVCSPRLSPAAHKQLQDARPLPVRGESGQHCSHRVAGLSS